MVAAIAGSAAIAIAASSAGSPPPPNPLPVAVHDALAAPPVEGVTARISFTNHLIDSSSVQGSNPIITGATGRLWASQDGQLRLELQSSNGDAQILTDSRHFSIYDGSSNTVYRGAIPKRASDRPSGSPEPIPSLAAVQRAIARLSKRTNLSGATPTDVAGQPAYEVRIGPKGHGGLLGAASVAWDAARGVPLRAAVYAAGNSSPVLKLAATDISYGKLSASDFNVSPPSDAKVVDLNMPTNSPPAGKRGANGKPVTGLRAVQRAVRFRISAPDKLAGLPLGQVKLLDSKREPAALVTYGRGLGGVAVVERSVKAEPANTHTKQHGPESTGLQLPKVSVGGVSGEELDTALGSLVRFQRAGVAYVVLGSVTPATIDAAARGL